MAGTADAGPATGQTYDTGTSGGAKEQAQEKAQEVKDQAKEQAQQVAGQARDRVRSEVDNRSTQAGEQVRTQANDLRSVGEELRSKGKDGPAKIADQVADRTERVGSWLADSDADRILGDIEDFGRRNPWAIVAGGLTLGFVASRFLKASSSERYQSSAGYGNGAQYRTRSQPRLPASTPSYGESTSGTPSQRFERPAESGTASTTEGL